MKKRWHDPTLLPMRAERTRCEPPNFDPVVETVWSWTVDRRVYCERTLFKLLVSVLRGNDVAANWRAGR